MATFIILIPLAVTSNNASIRRLGGQAWARLHRLVYLAAIGAALHFILVVKSWPPEPLVYAAIVAALAGVPAAPLARSKRASPDGVLLDEVNGSSYDVRPRRIGMTCP